MKFSDGDIFVFSLKMLKHSVQVYAGPPGIEPGTPGFLCNVCCLKARCSILTELRALWAFSFVVRSLGRCFLVFRLFGGVC